MTTSLGADEAVGRPEGPQCRVWFFLNKKSSSSASSPLGEAFPECAIFGFRGRRLPRETLPQTLFPRVALGEGFSKCMLHPGKTLSPVVIGMDGARIQRKRGQLLFFVLLEPLFSFLLKFL
jgi:hypothetical protein